MGYRRRIYFTVKQKAEIWDRWQRGESNRNEAMRKRLSASLNAAINGILIVEPEPWPSTKSVSASVGRLKMAGNSNPDGVAKITSSIMISQTSLLSQTIAERAVH